MGDSETQKCSDEITQCHVLCTTSTHNITIDAFDMFEGISVEDIDAAGVGSQCDVLPRHTHAGVLHTSNT